MGIKWFSTGLALPWLAFLLSCAPGKAPPPLRDPALAPGVEVDVELRGGELHAYPAELARGDAVVLAVTQDQIDVLVELFDPRGVSVLVVDGPNGPSGPEPLAVVAERGGIHWLEIRAPSRGAGSYRLRVEALGPAAENTCEYAAALRLYAAAERLRREQDGAALRQALALYRDALAKLEGLSEAPAEPEHVALWTARTTRRVGQMLDALGELQEALGVYERALAAYRELGADFEITPLLNSAGHAYRQLGEPARARQAFERALEISRALDNRIGEGTALNNLGVLSEALGETQAALDFYRQALTIWRQLGRAAYAATTLHNLGVSHLSLGRLDEGLVFLEQALALLREHDNRRDLAITLTAIGWARQGDGRHDEALAAYAEAIELARGVEDRQNQAVTLNLRGDVYREQGAWEAARASYEEALALLEGTGEGINEAHLLTQLGRVEEEGGKLDAARSLHERALDLFRRAGNLNGEATALLGLARTARLDGETATALARAEEAMGLVESLRFRLQSLAFRSSYFASRFDDHCFYIDLLMELGQVERALEARDPRLSGSDAFGATVASSRDLDRAVRDFEIESLSRLLHSGREAAAILALLPSGRRFQALGFDATREVVVGGELGSFSIVHFATHGLLNDRHPALSGLVFSLVDARGRARDGFLRVHEIPALRLDAELVVLSACRTALGREVRGEGLVGLAQGFFATGASQVIVSAWSVNDQATAELMVRFYRGLLEDGLSASQALREAQRSMLEEERWRAPYFWAAFMLQGDWR